MKLVLASSSKSRKKQLEQLRVPFICHSPEVDETALEHESADNLVLRLAKEKAYAVANNYREHVIIAGDQVHLVEGNIHGKPGDFETALEQLELAQGKKTEFLSGIAVHNTRTGSLFLRLVRTEVVFRSLTRAELTRYLELDQPYECAGSVRIEGLAPCLIESISAPDPTAITGMPLIICCEMLAASGFNCLDYAKI